MATFQVVYDDFSGGQYMGSRPANQPKNTWTGNNVIANANGELIPTGTRTAATFAGVATSVGQIFEHYYDKTYGYVFALYSSSTRMLKYAHTNGTAFPVTATNYTLTGTLNARPTYSNVTSSFYYAATNGNVYGVNALSGAITQTIASSQGAMFRLKAYKLRLVGVGINNPNRLIYTGAYTGSGYGTFASTNYYEFDSSILQIYPRTDDLLVICASGIYSLTGVLGSGVNIQMLTPQENNAGGMSQGAIVNRSLFYLDNAGDAGNIDGRLYRFLGASSQSVASFEYGDYVTADNGNIPGPPSMIAPLTNGRIGIQLRTGVTYFESSPGVFAKSQVWTPSYSPAYTSSETFRLARPIDDASDEYILTAVVDQTQTNHPITVYRTIANVPLPTKLDANFTTGRSTLSYKVKTSATTGDPGSSFIIYSTATQTSATRINVSHTDSNSLSNSSFLTGLTSNNTFIIQDRTNSSNYQKWKLTGAPTAQTGYVEIPVTLLESGGTGTTNFANNLDVTLYFNTVNPSGTVELSEYWHNKPFTVKEVFVEYSITTGGSVSCSIIPTGVVDVPEANLASVVSTAASETSPPAGGYRMYRYWPNNAAKGFGVKPQLAITNCFVKRVILNCED